MLLLTLGLPVLGACILFTFRKMSAAWRNGIFLTFTCLTSLAVLALLMGPRVSYEFTSPIELSFKLDGLGSLFAGLIAILWPLAAVYSIGYMSHEGNQRPFFGYYLLSYGVTLGVSFSGDPLTMFVFYELLGLSTLFLVMHKLSPSRVHAGRKYMYYSIGGGSLALMAVLFLKHFANGSIHFNYGGIAFSSAVPLNVLLIMFVFAFLGFGVKAAVFPLHGWLPAAGVAPTPVTALLHAVAVVKAGVFAVIRMSYYAFPPDLVRGTLAQQICLGLAIVSILYGSSMAVKEKHLKRRLAYSTMSNLSYVLFGALLLTPQGLTGGLAHMVFHAFMKITLFACVGAIMVQTNRQYVEELWGMAKVMPITIGIFGFCAITLVGIPPFIGFQSKWALALAGIGSGSVLSYIGVGALIYSAILTAIYILVPVVTAYVMPLSQTPALDSHAHDPGNCMKIPLIILAIMVLVLSFCSQSLMQLLSNIAMGAF